MHSILKYNIILAKDNIKRMLGIILVLFLALFIVFLAGRLYLAVSEKDDSAGKIRVGVVLEDEDPLFSQMLMFVNSLEGVKSFCRIEVVEGDARQLIDSGQIQMAIAVPKDFMKNAMAMMPAKIKIIVHKDSSGAEKQLLALMETIQQIICATEGAIYAVDEGITLYGIKMERRGMEDAVMYEFMSYFMMRDDLFSVNFVSAHGDFTFVQYYLGAAALLLILSLCVVFMKTYSSEYLSAERVMCRDNAGRITLAVSRVINLTVFIGIMLIIAEALANVMMSILSDDVVIQSRINIGESIIVAFSVACMIQLFAILTVNNRFRYSIYYLMILIMSLLSGVLGSIYYLPKGLRTIAGIWPIRQWHMIIVNSLWGNGGHNRIATVIVMDMIMLAVGSAVYIRKLRSHE